MNRSALLMHHLCFNHYPPVSDVFVPVAEAAIDHASEGKWDEMITMPNGVVLSVGEIVDQLHLLDFLEVEG